ncbi:hypothetical protein MRX96_051759 [Rhipicephalus microplus]
MRCFRAVSHSFKARSAVLLLGSLTIDNFISVPNPDTQCASGLTGPLAKLELPPQHATSGSNMSDLNGSTSDDSFFHRTSLDPLVIDISEEEKQETVQSPGCTSPLSSAGLDENSDDTRETATQHEHSSSSDELGLRKRSMTLNLYSPGASQPSHKQARCSSLLTSPGPADAGVVDARARAVHHYSDRTGDDGEQAVCAYRGQEKRSNFRVTSPNPSINSSCSHLYFNSTPRLAGTRPTLCDSTSNDTRTHPLSSEPETVPIDMRDTDRDTAHRIRPGHVGLYVKRQSHSSFIVQDTNGTHLHT